MMFYIEQLLLLPGKLDETERQIIPFDIRPRKYCFYFPIGTFEFSRIHEATNMHHPILRVC